MKDSKNQRALANFEKVRLTICQNQQLMGGCCGNAEPPDPPGGGNDNTGG